MSEYQYYEFLAIDQPLAEREMLELRAISGRATITSTSFVNTYNWGDLKADPRRLVERYFDAFVYVANWGTRRFMLRLPRDLIDKQTVAPFCADRGAAVTTKGKFILLDFWSDEEGGEWEDGEGWLSGLAPLRADLLAGDLRCLYLGWLLCAEIGSVGDDQLEPLLPPGCPSVRERPAPLQAFADFLRIDPHLVAVAAEGMPCGPSAAASRDALSAWIRELPGSEKDALLLRVAEGEGPPAQWEILKRFREDRALTEPNPSLEAKRRTVAQLLQLRDERARESERRLAEQRAEEKARLAREQARARKQHLDGLAGRENEIWQEIEALVRAGQWRKYDEAVGLATDLRDLASRQGTSGEFESRLERLRERHRRKPSLLRRLDRVRPGE